MNMRRKVSPFPKSNSVVSDGQCLILPVYRNLAHFSSRANWKPKQPNFHWLVAPHSHSVDDAKRHDIDSGERRSLCAA